MADTTHGTIFARYQKAITKEMMTVLSNEARLLARTNDESDEEASAGLYKYFMMASDESLCRLYKAIDQVRINIVYKR